MKNYLKSMPYFWTAFLSFVIAIALQISNLHWELSHKIFHDDSYYYLQTAVNYVSSGLMSFDRVSTTNGYHPLWMWLLISILSVLKIFGVNESQRLVVELVLLFGATFLFITVSLIISTARDAGMLSKIALSTVLILISWPFFFNGMETPIAILFFTYIIIALTHKNFPINDISFIWLLFAVCCLVLSRLDAVALLPAIIIGSYVRFGKRGALLVLLSATIGIFLAIFQSYLAIGEFVYMPISSTVKKWWANNIFNEHLNICLSDKTLFRCYLSLIISKLLMAAYMFSDQLNMLWAFVMPKIIFASSSIFPTKIISVTNILIITTMALFYIRKLYVTRGNLASLIIIGLMISGGGLLLTSFLFSFQMRAFSWYLWSILPFLYLSYVNLRIFRIPFVCLCLIIILLIGTYQVIVKSGPSEWAKGYQAIADHVNSNLDLHIGGTWAAGHIGFASKGKIINLEGLISEGSVYKANEERRLARYIIDNDIDFLIYNSKMPNSISGVLFFERIRIEPILKLKPCLSEIEAYNNGGEVKIHLYKIDKNCTNKLVL